MKTKTQFYFCEKCGNIIAYAKNSGVPVVCCGEVMSELIPNTVDASNEKHVPVIKQKGGHVTVHIGSVDHPMVDVHYIEWVFLQTKQGNQRKQLFPGDKPEACFEICDGDEIEAAYEYCNIHGLWKAEV